MDELGRETSIEDYAAVGDCRTLALVSRFGAIDWCCLPDFPSPSVFAALLDREHGGRFALTPRSIANAVQRYLPRTNVVRTRIECTGGVLQLTDFMAMPDDPRATGDQQQLVRIVECVQGVVEVDVRFAPRPDYARSAPQIRPDGDRCWTCRLPSGRLTLRTSFALAGDDQALDGSLTLREGELHAAVLVASSGGPTSGSRSPAQRSTSWRPPSGGGSAGATAAPTTVTTPTRCCAARWRSSC